jgi:membrane-associated phospholipid phosphatase
MPRKLILLTALSAMTATAFSQGNADAPVTGSRDEIKKEIYRIKPGTDIPILVAGAAWDLYGFAQISKKEDASPATVENLKKSDINWFDRWAVRPYNKSVDNLSYVPFYAAVPAPLLLFAIDRRMRKDYLKLTFLYGEAMTLTGVLYTSAVHYVSRYRPLVYSPESPLNERTSSNSKNSFFAGHVALVGTSVFFMAKTWADYHPESKWKWLVYGGAGAVTALTGWWRHRAGEHFPSDILLGAAVGVSSGLLVPQLHKVRLIRNSHLSILPFSSLGQALALSSRTQGPSLSGRSQGMTLFYKL